MLKIITKDNKRLVWDVVRKKYVAYTPEEHVRQNFINHLITNLSYPVALMAVEYGLQMNGMSRRCDIVVFSRKGFPVLIVECKAEDVKITDKTFRQIAHYNIILKVDYLVVTNGIAHFACKINHQQQNYSFIKELPRYEDLEG